MENFDVQDRLQMMINHEVKCNNCGKISKMPSHIYSVVFGLAPEADLVQYTYNCECGNKQKL